MAVVLKTIAGLVSGVNGLKALGLTAVFLKKISLVVTALSGQIHRPQLLVCPVQFL